MSDTSQFIRLLDATGTKVLDTVSAEYEDSFCLESFGDLIKSANEAPGGPKRFIIARVQTWDAKQPDKAFYSYYHAHHLNKILFQTQMYLGKKLIHRLHVLNPLTNTDIIGHVLYFMVKEKAPKVESKLEDVSLNDSKEPPSPRSLKGPGLKVSITHSKSFPPPSPSVNKDLQGTDTLELNRIVHNGDVDEKKDKKEGWTVASTITGIAEQGEEIPSSPKLESMDPSIEFPPTQQNILKKARKMSIKQATLDGSEAELITLAQPPPQTEVEHPNATRTSKSMPSSPDKISIPAGVLTQRGAPLTPQELKTVIKIESKNGSKSRRRSLSYANTLSASAEPNVSWNDWKEMVKTERTNLDAVKESTEKLPSSVKEPDDEYYDAILIATDTDFLESSRTRQIFRENATVPDEAALFEMPPFTGQQTTTPSPRRRPPPTDICIACDCLFPTPTQMYDPNPYRRCWHKSKGYLVICLLTAVIFVLIFVILRAMTVPK